MKNTIHVLLAVLCAAILAFAAPGEKEERIMNEILDVMQHFAHKDEEKAPEQSKLTPTVTVTPSNPFEMVKQMGYETCPAMDDYYIGKNMTATCTEVTFKCKHPNHVLVFDNGETDETTGMCFKQGTASEHCNDENKVNVPRCTPACIVPEVENAHWHLHSGEMISKNQVLPGSEISYTCTSIEYSVNSTERLLCKDDGEFEGKLPTCEDRAYENITQCGEGKWIKIYSFDMPNENPPQNTCPRNWKRVEKDGVIGCHGKVNGACSPVFIELGNLKPRAVCGKAIGYQIAFPDAFYASSGQNINNLYVDGLSITFGFPRVHVWTYGVGASKRVIYGGTEGNCPCQQGKTQPHSVGSHMYCDSGHRPTPEAAIEAYGEKRVYSTIFSDNPLWEEECTYEDDETKTCCGDDYFKQNLTPPWFRRLDLADEFQDPQYTSYGGSFELRLCSHEVDMQEGALITEFELYIQE